MDVFYICSNKTNSFHFYGPYKVFFGPGKISDDLDKIERGLKEKYSKIEKKVVSPSTKVIGEPKDRLVYIE